MPPTLQDALLHHQAGELSRAALLYQEMLISDPQHADAYHLLGVLMHQLQHTREAVELIDRAIQINSKFAPYHNNLGNALVALGRRDDARESFHRSIRLSRNADTYINLAALELGDGRMREAKTAFKAALRLSPKRLDGLVGLARIALIEDQGVHAKRWLQRALAIEPGCHAALNLLGDLHSKEGRLCEAEDHYIRATEAFPSDIDAHLKLGHLYMQMERYTSASEAYSRAFQLSPESHGVALLLGMAHLMNEDAMASKDAFLRALQLDERHPATHYLLGNSLVLGREYKKALASFKHSLSLDPSLHEAMSGMGNAYDGLGDYIQAAAACETALALQPQNSSYLQNMGINLARRGDIRAISYLDKAVVVDPNNANAHIALAESLLLFGNYRRGFAEYEWRWRSLSFSKPHRRYDGPLWDGSPLLGKTILLHAEQGLGDTIQFVRFLPQVARLGGILILLVQRPLFRLFESLKCISVCLCQDTDRLPPFDVHCPLLSLPFLLGTEVHTIPGPIDLSASVPKGQHNRLNGKLNVGLAWAGSPTHARDLLRSLPLGALLPLRDVDGSRFFSLQKQIPSADAEALQAFGMQGPGDVGQDLLDTAYAMNDLDLVISVDTAIGHLAATLGKRVWLVLQEAADWRWGITSDTSPWYPTMKLVRRLPGETNVQLGDRLVTALNEEARTLLLSEKQYSPSDHTVTDGDL